MNNLIQTKSILIDHFISSCKDFWNKDINTPVFGDMSRIENIDKWDRNKMDVHTEDSVIRVSRTNAEYFISNMIYPITQFKINENEFINLQKEYFREYL